MDFLSFILIFGGGAIYLGAGYLLIPSHGPLGGGTSLEKLAFISLWPFFIMASEMDRW